MTPTAAPPSRGRPRQFDPDEVLDQLLRVFWEKGFEATSISDLVEATGLNKSSLYNEFGSKDAAYRRALEHYMEARLAIFREVLANGTGGLEDVETLLAFMRQEVESEIGGRGCFAVNDATELGARTERAQASSLHWRTEMRAAMSAALHRAEERGEIAPGTAATYTEVFIPWMLGMSVVARGGADVDEVDSLFDAAAALIEGIRVG